MEDALDIRITNSNNIVSAEKAYKQIHRYSTSREGYPKGYIVDCYCPECHAPVILKKKKNSIPYFEHEHLSDDVERECSRYTNCEDANYKPDSIYSKSGKLPMYLLGKTGVHRLRVYFPHIKQDAYNRLCEMNVRLQILTTNKQQFRVENLN